MLHHCLLTSVISCFISVMKWIHDLDACIATWPCSSLANSMRKAYAARLHHYSRLMEQLGTAPWPQDHRLLGQNLARFMVHLAAEQSLQASTIHSYLAGIQLELLDRGLHPKLAMSEQLQTLLAAIEWDGGKPQHCKQPITTTLLCQFITLLSVAPAKV